MPWSQRISAAAWIEPRLDPFHSGRVTSVVPNGFDAYARILHPAHDVQRDRAVRWAEIARWSGSELDAETQFHDIAIPYHAPADPEPWNTQGPLEGTLTAADASVLTGILREFTATPEQCWFCLWEGFCAAGNVRYSHFTDSGTPRNSAEQPKDDILTDPIPPKIRNGPRVRLPNRDYFLRTGPVEDAVNPVGSGGEAANLFWPEDRSWCVAGETDLASTYVGGSVGLIDQLIADSRIEVLRVSPEHDHHLRLRGWHADAVDTMVEKLMTSGTAVLEHWSGKVEASLDRPGLLRKRRHFRVRVQTCSGSASESDGRIPAGTEEEVRERIRSELTREWITLSER